MDQEPTATEALDVPAPRARRLRPWMIIASGALVVVVAVGVALALVLPGPTGSPSSVSKPSSSPETTVRPTSSATAQPGPSATPVDAGTAAEPEEDEEPVAPPVAAPAAPAPPAPAAPAAPGPPALPPPPAPIVTPTITTFTATNYNDSTQTIAQGCAASSNGELSVRVTWATENTTPTIKFRTKISGSPVVDTTITGYSASGDNHFLQLRCSKIAYVTMTLHSDNMERQARLTIDGNGSAGWSYL